VVYRVRMIVKNIYPGTGVTREVVTRFAGCRDDIDARQKARDVYDVVVFKKVEPIEES
jgi:hypothetical protein